jgi:predicted aminopeptidase
MKKWFKRIGLSLLGIILILVIFKFQLVKYGIEQAQGQLKIVYSARPFDEVLNDAAVPDSIKTKLLLIREIKKYAEDSLGINKSENYESFYDQKGKPAIYVITACSPFELKEYQWTFPFLGSFSYKGFFNLARAKKEEEILKHEGLDTDLGTASGWSTLGWFKDPVLSGMLKRKEGSLANLIIHELTHGTLYIRDSVDYNENLASFIGDKGAIKFLKYKYGNESTQLGEYENSKEDREKYIAHILTGAKELEAVYQKIKQKNTKEKLKIKRLTIAEIISNLDTIKFHNKSYYTADIDADSINNTFFIDFKRYNSKQDNFEKEFYEKFNGDLKAYLKYLKNKYPSL